MMTMALPAACQANTKRMKLAFVVNSFPSLSETFIQAQIVGLIQRGYEIEIDAEQPSHLPKLHADIERFRLMERINYRPSMPLSWPPRLQSAASRVFRWGCRHPGIALDSLNALRHGRRAMNLSLIHDRLPAYRQPRNYDLIHCHYGPNGQRAVAARRVGALQGPIITTFHGFDVNRLPKIYGPNFYADLFEEGDFFTVGSEFMRQKIVALGAPEDRIAKLPMGVDIARYQFLEKKEPHDGKVQLLTVARLVENKGIQFVIRAIAAIRKDLPGIRYVIAGDGPLRSDLEKLVDQLGLGGNVEFAGAVSQEEVLALYEAAHGFVLAGIETKSGDVEGQAVVLAEAQAAGLPVIATAVGGMPESMRNEESGLLVPPGDIEALANAIRRLAQHPESWARMGRAGRAHVEANFDQDKLLDRLVGIYGDILSFLQQSRFETVV
jgi:colanic acid/amylovoran biosynthesis glycosyltransferase